MAMKIGNRIAARTTPTRAVRESSKPSTKAVAKAASAKGAASTRALRYPPPGVEIKPAVWKRMSKAERQEVWRSASSPAATTPPATTPPATTPPATTPPATTPPATTGLLATSAAAAASPEGLLGLAPGSTRKAEIKQLQDTLMELGFLEDLHQNAGYGSNFGPKTQAGLKAFQQANGLPQSGIVDRGTVVALARATGYDLGFDAASPFAPCFGLANGASAPADKAAIKQLQDTLIAAGYLPPSMRQDGGYGSRFGPRTEAGLRQFQLENGLPQTGVVDAATLGALGAPRPRPAGFASGSAVAYRDQLGLPTSAPYQAPDGSLRQDFDHGSVWVSPDRIRHVEVKTAGGVEDVVPPQKLGTAQTVEEANASFLTQWGPTATNDPPTGSDVPWGYYDCGPTCGVMALAALGLAAKPSAADAYLAIDKMRDQIIGSNTSKSLGLNLGPASVPYTVAHGLVEAGAECTMLGKGDLDAALDRGNPVIIGSSTTYAAWGREQLLAKNYLNGGDPSGHFVIVLGKAANGNYLVGDPLVKGGVIEVTPDQMKTCLGGAWNANSLMEVSAP